MSAMRWRWRGAVATEGEFFAQVAFAVLFFAALAEGEAVVVVNVVVSLDEEAARAEAAVFGFFAVARLVIFLRVPVGDGDAVHLSALAIDREAAVIAFVAADAAVDVRPRFARLRAGRWRPAFLP